MKTLQTILLCLISLASSSLADKPNLQSNKGVTKAVHSIMQIFAEGDYLLIIPKRWETGGGIVKGKHRNITGKVLMMQSKSVTIYGPLAIPELLKWTDHEDPAVRYIAASALIDITKLKPTFLFHKEGSLLGDEAWLLNAKKVWLTWRPTKTKKEK